MERLAQYNLRKYTKEDIIDLLEEHPDLLTMSKEDLTKLAQDKYADASGHYDRCMRLESDASAIEQFRDAKFGGAKND